MGEETLLEEDFRKYCPCRLELSLGGTRDLQI
jgi:hypothetical protein